MNFNRILNSQTKTVTFAAILLGISSGISSILGLVRDGLLAGYFGAWGETNPYFAAFTINDFFYNLLIVGGLVVAFLPLFSEYYSKDKEKAWEMTNYILNTFLFLLIIASLFIFAFSPQLVKIVAPGFAPDQRALTANLIRVMILSPIFFGLSSIFSGILQYFNRFLVYSIIPIIYNLGIIFGILVLSPHLGIIGVGIGVTVGAAFYFLFQIPSVINCGFKYRSLFNLKYPAIKRIFYLALPRLFSITSQQINLIIITAIASTIVGGITIFNFANNIQYFPIGIFAIPFAIAAFPTLSKYWARNQKSEFLENFSSILRQILFLMIPVSLFIFILRAQIVRLILGTLGETGKFDWAATQLTAASLGLFSIGILGTALIPFISRAFFSLQDTKTPTIIAILSVVLNIILSFSLVWLLRFPNFFQYFIVRSLKLEGIEDLYKISIIGLPLAFSIVAIFQLILLSVSFYKRIGNFKLKEILSSILKFSIFTILSAFVCYKTLYFVDNFVDTDKVVGLFLQTISALFAGLLFYFLPAFFLKFPELFIFISSFKKQFRKGIITQEIEVMEP